MSTQDDDALPRVEAVALKFSPFWSESAEVWFAQAEAQFNIKGVSSSTTKFYHCVAAMSQEVASQLLDLIASLPYSLKTKSLVLFFEGCFFVGCLLMFVHTFYRKTYPILML